MKSGSKLLLFCFLTGILSCEEDKIGHSVIPKIEIISAKAVNNEISGRDSIILVEIGYIDGDGDIGLGEDDSMPPFDVNSKYFFNLFVEFYEIINGERVPFLLPVTNDTIRFDQRIPNLTPSGKNKNIEGEIVLKLPTEPFPDYFPDSVMFSIQLLDRALNKSNIVETPVIKLIH